MSADTFTEEDHARIGEAISDAISQKPVRVCINGGTASAHAAYIHPDWCEDHGRELVRVLRLHGFEIRRSPATPSPGTGRAER